MYNFDNKFDDKFDDKFNDNFKNYSYKNYKKYILKVAKNNFRTN